MKTEQNLKTVAVLLLGIATLTTPTQAAEKAATTGARLEVIAVEPNSPATLKAGERAKVKIRYQCATVEGFRIWAQPYSKGSRTPDGFYAPSASIPKGEGTVERFVGANSPAVVDELRVILVDAATKKTLAETKYSVHLKYEGTVPKPSTIAPVGKPFPKLKFTSITGQDVDVAKLKGKVVLVDFWATWCGPCRKEMPNLIAAYEKHHANGFEIVGISLDEKKDALERYIKENKMPWPQFFDGKGWKNEISRRFAVNSIPCSYLIDRKGVVSQIDARGRTLAEAIAKLVAEKP